MCTGCMRLRQLTNLSVNYKFRTNIRLFGLVARRFNHREPPRKCYTELAARTATKSSGKPVESLRWFLRNLFAHSARESPKSARKPPSARSSEHDSPTPPRAASTSLPADHPPAAF